MVTVKLLIDLLASLLPLTVILTIVPSVFPNDESFHVDSIQDEGDSHTEQKRSHDNFIFAMIGWIREVWRYAWRG